VGGLIEGMRCEGSRIECVEERLLMQLQLHGLDVWLRWLNYRGEGREMRLDDEL
jgi:hypothetical protein